tara:strand:+ start:37927 stop:38526 length:600 start_codon:yes stop_codon:yes gene_type:complete
MKLLLKITLVILASALALQSKVMAQAGDVSSGADYKDKMMIDADYKKELLALGFKDGKYLELNETSISHHPYIVVNKVVHTAEVSALRPDGTALKGRVPTDVSQEDLLVASRLACVGAINVIKHAAGGDLSRVRKIANIRYLTLSEPEYIDYALVSNECSTLMVRVFGQTVGSHTRFAMGLVSSPNNESFKLNLIAYLK